MDLNGQPVQFEFIINRPQNTTAVLNGDRLIGDIDSMYANSVTLYQTDKELKSILLFNTSFVVTDTDGHTIDASTDLMINVYNYEHKLGVEEIYGLCSYATIFNYMTLTNFINSKGFLHNDEIYRPTVIVPSFDKMKEQIIQTRNKAYGLT